MLLDPATWPLFSAIHAFVLLAAVELGLRLLPFRSVIALLARRHSAATRTAAPETPEVQRVVRQVEACSRLIPGSKCLGIALTVQALLARRGYALRLRIGVARPKTAPAHGYHAWLESGEVVIVGGAAAPFMYVPVPLSLVRERSPLAESEKR